MKLRKLLRKAREQYAYYDINEIITPTYDGKQFEVIELVLMPPGAGPSSFKYRLCRCATIAECEEYIKCKRWRTIEHNIELLRKKYKRPSKHKEISEE